MVKASFDIPWLIELQQLMVQWISWVQWTVDTMDTTMDNGLLINSIHQHHQLVKARVDGQWILSIAALFTVLLRSNPPGEAPDTWSGDAVITNHYSSDQREPVWANSKQE